jgi:hypothetical protein
MRRQDDDGQERARSATHRQARIPRGGCVVGAFACEKKR